MLAQALMQGLLAGGVGVMDVGMVTTPMLYFAAHTVCASGVQVTGSHNPKDDNGFKMVLAGQDLRPHHRTPARLDASAAGTGGATGAGAVFVA